MTCEYCGISYLPHGNVALCPRCDSDPGICAEYAAAQEDLYAEEDPFAFLRDSLSREFLNEPIILPRVRFRTNPEVLRNQTFAGGYTRGSTFPPELQAYLDRKRAAGEARGKLVHDHVQSGKVLDIHKTS